MGDIGKEKEVIEFEEIDPDEIPLVPEIVPETPAVPVPVPAEPVPA